MADLELAALMAKTSPRVYAPAGKFFEGLDQIWKTVTYREFSAHLPSHHPTSVHDRFALRGKVDLRFDSLISKSLLRLAGNVRVGRFEKMIHFRPGHRVINLSLI